MNDKNKARIIDMSGLSSILLFSLGAILTIFSLTATPKGVDVLKQIPDEFYIIYWIILTISLGVFVFYEDGWKSWKKMNPKQGITELEQY